MKKIILITFAVLLSVGSVWGQELNYTGNETFQGDGECYQIVYDREGKALLGKKVPCPAPCPAFKKEFDCHWEFKEVAIFFQINPFKQLITVKALEEIALKNTGWEIMQFEKEYKFKSKEFGPSGVTEYMTPDAEKYRVWLKRKVCE